MLGGASVFIFKVVLLAVVPFLLRITWLKLNNPKALLRLSLTFSVCESTVEFQGRVCILLLGI